MADNYKEYLATRVIAENRPVTYRLLSRALKVNVNVAKQMLYEFHSKQNAKKPSSVHATYLLTGRKRAPEDTNGVNGRDGADLIMQSSPFMSMQTQETETPDEAAMPKTSIVLVREEELESTKSDFEKITSIHVYSLEPGPIESLNLLSVCNHEVASEHSGDDPMERWRLYGSIQNPYVKRRTGKSAPAAAAASKAAPKSAPKAQAKPAPAPASNVKVSAPLAKKATGTTSEESSRQATPQPTTTGTLKKSDSKPNLKREKSDIFKSFAKAKAKSKESTPAPVEDAPMQGMSEDEADDGEPEIKFDEEKAAQARKAREEREEKLRRMMEESDDEMPDVAPETEKNSQESAQSNPPPVAPAERETVAAPAGDGRRRGRRLVTKRKKVKDEEGYLVTKEEQVWESFSEDEPQPKKLKPVAKPVNTAKGKQKGKPGQSIASFFKKA